MDEDDSLILLLLEEEKKKKKLRLEEAQRVRNRSGGIRRAALQHPKYSSFMRLYNSGNDPSLIALCGFDHESFESLLKLFTPLFNSWSPYPQKANKKFHMRRVRQTGRTGRKRQIDATICLGLVLAWTRTRGSTIPLQVIFGMTANPVSVWLRFGRRLLVKVLQNHPDAEVRMPTRSEIASFKAVIREKYPVLKNVWGAMDGLKVLIEANPDLENIFYNGWKCDHYISNLFVFSPDGRIRACYINAPGSWHDSTLAHLSKIYEKLDAVHDSEQRRGGGRIVVDSAFGSENRPSLLKSYQNNVDRQGRVRNTREMYKAATSVRQLSEWGMRGLQASFPRLKDRLKYEEMGERKIVLSLIVLLYNYRASCVGFNQIRTTFYPHLYLTGQQGYHSSLS